MNRELRCFQSKQHKSSPYVLLPHKEWLRGEQMRDITHCWVKYSFNSIAYRFVNNHRTIIACTFLSKFTVVLRKSKTNCSGGAVSVISTGPGLSRWQTVCSAPSETHSSQICPSLPITSLPVFLFSSADTQRQIRIERGRMSYRKCLIGT